MDPADRAQRALALRAIADKTKELEDAGADPITVKTFSAGAQRELARQKPDVDKYKSAFVAAGNFKRQNSGPEF